MSKLTDEIERQRAEDASKITLIQDNSHKVSVKKIILAIISIIVFCSVFVLSLYEYNKKIENDFKEELYKYVAFDFIASSKITNLQPKPTDSYMPEDIVSDYNIDDKKEIEDICSMIIDEKEFLLLFKKYEKRYSNEIQEWAIYFENTSKLCNINLDIYEKALEVKDILNKDVYTIDEYRKMLIQAEDRFVQIIDLTESTVDLYDSIYTCIDNLFEKYDYYDYENPNMMFDDYFDQCVSYQKTFDISELYKELN